METDIECPSGLKGRIRAWKLKDRGIYKDQKVLRSNTLIQQMVQRVWVKTTDPGPYNFDSGSIDWGRVLQGDSFWAFIQSRRLSKGDIYVFRVPCPSCHHAVETPFDLSELTMQRLHPESLDAVRSDRPIEIEVDGRSVKFKLLRTEDNKRVAGIEDNFDLDGEYGILAARLVEVDGIAGQVARMRFIQNLDEGEADRILAAMEEYDCGADTRVKLVCAKCYYQWSQNLPLQPSFFRTETPSRQTEEAEIETMEETERGEEVPTASAG